MICSVNQVGKTYGERWVLDSVSLQIRQQDRLGLVGANGSGKTTLLRLLAGRETPDRGEIYLKKGAKVGYLEQVPNPGKSATVEEVLRQPFSELAALEEQMNQLAEKMAQPGIEKEDQLQQLLSRYQTCQESFERKGGYEIDAHIKRVTQGLGLGGQMQSRPFLSLSGGEKTKVGLARILLMAPDLLLLDEPTNHLDLASLEWLEEYLNQYSGAVVMVSHDRYFLDRTVQSIVDLEEGEVTCYQGNYTSFVKAKEDCLMAQFQAYQEQQKKIKKMREAIKRLREWANRGNPPNDGMHRRAASMEKALNRMEKVKRPVLERKKMGISFEMGQRSGQDVVRFRDVSKTYNNRRLFHKVNLLVRFGERQAIVGENGSGKSTLLKLMLDQEIPDQGQVQVGSSVKVGYLSQEGWQGDEDLTVSEAFRQSVSVSEEESRRILARFLFYGYAVFRRVKNLSGGERMRLRLAQIMHQDVNVLLLDEPTNHLDIDSREVLEDALADFPGTIVAVSHDRYFLNRLFQVVNWLESECLTRYEGNYDEARRKRNNLGKA